MKEISKDLWKSLITPLPTGRQGFRFDYTDGKMKRAYNSFSELSKGEMRDGIFINQ
jgi:hypothetical protein